CSEICIPGEADLKLSLPVTAAPAAADPANAALFAAARRKQPQPAGFATRFAASGPDLILHIPAAALAGLSDPTASFFPNEPNIIDAAAEPRTRISADGIDVALKRASGPAALATLPPGIDGVLALHG